MARKKKIALLGLLIFVAYLFISNTQACSVINTDRYPELVVPASPAKEPERTGPEIAVSIIRTGHSTHLEGLVFRSGSYFKRRGLIPAAVLIQHPRATFLFDTGLGTDHQAHMQEIPIPFRWLLGFDDVRPAVGQLEVDEKVDFIILSHLHYDHAGGIADFPDALLRVTKAQWNHALNGSKRTFVRSQFSSPHLKKQWLRLADLPYENFDRSLDLFGDGSAVLVPLPGHTPGALGLFVRLQDGKRIFFSGDLSWALEGLTLPVERPLVARFMVDQDDESVRRNLVRVHLLKEKYKENLILVPAHDEAALNRFPLYPKFMR